MAVDLTVLFTRLGVIEDLRQKVSTHQALIETEIADILDEYNADRDLAAQLQPSLDALKASAGAPHTILRDIARKTLIKMVQDDNPQPTENVRTALVELIDQMGASSDSLDANDTGSSIATDGDNTGTGKLIVDTSVRDYSDALVERQHIRAEDVVVECVSDAQVRGTAAKDEQFSVQGEPSVKDIGSTDWPGGSGMNGTLRITTADEDAKDGIAGRQMLANGNFEDFTVSNEPDNWIEVVGSFGTQVLEEATTVFRGSKSLEIVGDAGGTLTEFKQTFNTAGQSTAKLRPFGTYGISFWARKSASLAAGVMDVVIVNGSDGNAFAGVQFDKDDLSSSAWTHFSVTGSVGAVLVTPYRLRVRVTTALTDGQSVFIDDLIVAPVVRLHVDGPGFLVVPGATAFKLRDKFVATMSNDGAGELVDACDRFFGLYGLGLIPQIPVDDEGGETIADSLIA